MRKDLDLSPNEKIIYEDEDGLITEMETMDGMSLYTVYTQEGVYLDEFEELTLTPEEKEKIEDTYVFKNYVDILAIKDSYLQPYNDDWGYSYSSKSFLSKYEPKPKTPEEIAKEKELVESLCKSDTIVFHQTDPTTVMLDPIYEGKGFDVYKGSAWGGPLSRESIHELIKRHDRIVCLGHGTSHGLLSGVIGEEEVPLLRDKKIFSMWCYAAEFWKNNGFEGHGILTTSNFPSECWECRAACGSEVSKKWIFDNMMLAGEIAGRAMDIGWDDPQAGCDLFRKEYSEKSKITTEDERKVVEYNTESMQVV